MLQFLDQLPFSILIVFALFMLLAPFHPMPHVVEKIIMLKNGQLNRPLDIFDLFFHLAPLLLLGLKWWLSSGRS
ncbi:MAG: RND transporter [Desulfurivibrionaceae bacterium]